LATTEKRYFKILLSLLEEWLFQKDIGLTLENVDVNAVGTAEKVIVTKDNTTIIGGKGTKENVDKRVKQIKEQIKKADKGYNKEKLQERLGKLTSGVAVMKVGAATEVEQKEKQHRIEDALAATKAAVEEGVVPGGGVALIRTIKGLDSLTLTGDEKIGKRIVKKALEAPLKQIAQNAGVEGSVVVDKVKKLTGANGYNAAKNTYEDLYPDFLKT